MAITPLWELHIRPMFRLTDRDHMLFRFDLFDYDQIVAHKDDMVARIDTDMPPASTGGPWPEEWRALFDRWVRAGCPRLGSAANVKYSLVPGANNVTLVGEGEQPESGTVWFDRSNENEPREYCLVRRPGRGNKKFKAQEKLPAGTTTVIVRDADGVHTVSST